MLLKKHVFVLLVGSLLLFSIGSNIRYNNDRFSKNQIKDEQVSNENFSTFPLSTSPQRTDEKDSFFEIESYTSEFTQNAWSEIVTPATTKRYGKYTRTTTAIDFVYTFDFERVFQANPNFLIGSLSLSVGVDIYFEIHFPVHLEISIPNEIYGDQVYLANVTAYAMEDEAWWILNLSIPWSIGYDILGVSGEFSGSFDFDPSGIFTTPIGDWFSIWGLSFDLCDFLELTIKPVITTRLEADLTYSGDIIVDTKNIEFRKPGTNVIKITGKHNGINESTVNIDISNWVYIISVAFDWEIGLAGDIAKLLSMAFIPTSITLGRFPEIDLLGISSTFSFSEAAIYYLPRPNPVTFCILDSERNKIIGINGTRQYADGTWENPGHAYLKLIASDETVYLGPIYNNATNHSVAKFSDLPPDTYSYQIWFDGALVGDGNINVELGTKEYSLCCAPPFVGYSNFSSVLFVLRFKNRTTFPFLKTFDDVYLALYYYNQNHDSNLDPFDSLTSGYVKVDMNPMTPSFEDKVRLRHGEFNPGCRFARGIYLVELTDSQGGLIFKAIFDQRLNITAPRFMVCNYYHFIGYSGDQPFILSSKYHNKVWVIYQSRAQWSFQYDPSNSNISNVGVFGSFQVALYSYTAIGALENGSRILQFVDTSNSSNTFYTSGRFIRYEILTENPGFPDYVVPWYNDTDPDPSKWHYVYAMRVIYMTRFIPYEVPVATYGVLVLPGYDFAKDVKIDPIRPTINRIYTDPEEYISDSHLTIYVNVSDNVISNLNGYIYYSIEGQWYGDTMSKTSSGSNYAIFEYEIEDIGDKNYFKFYVYISDGCNEVRGDLELPEMLLMAYAIGDVQGDIVTIYDASQAIFYVDVMDKDSGVLGMIYAYLNDTPINISHIQPVESSQGIYRCFINLSDIVEPGKIYNIKVVGFDSCNNQVIRNITFRLNNFSYNIPVTSYVNTYKSLDFTELKNLGLKYVYFPESIDFYKAKSVYLIALTGGTDTRDVIVLAVCPPSFEEIMYIPVNVPEKNVMGPVIKVVGNTLYLLYFEHYLEGGYNICVAKSEDFGKTWTRLDKAVLGDLMENKTLSEPNFVIDNDNNIYIFWKIFETEEVYYIKYSGSSWSSPTLAPFSPIFYYSVEFGTDGQWHILLRRLNEKPKYLYGYYLNSLSEELLPFEPTVITVDGGMCLGANDTPMAIFSVVENQIFAAYRSDKWKVFNISFLHFQSVPGVIDLCGNPNNKIISGILYGTLSGSSTIRSYFCISFDALEQQQQQQPTQPPLQIGLNPFTFLITNIAIVGAGIGYRFYALGDEMSEANKFGLFLVVLGYFIGLPFLYSSMIPSMNIVAYMMIAASILIGIDFMIGSQSDKTLYGLMSPIGVCLSVVSIYMLLPESMLAAAIATLIAIPAILIGASSPSSEKLPSAFVFIYYFIILTIIEIVLWNFFGVVLWLAALMTIIPNILLGMDMCWTSTDEDGGVIIFAGAGIGIYIGEIFFMFGYETLVFLLQALLLPLLIVVSRVQ